MAIEDILKRSRVPVAFAAATYALVPFLQGIDSFDAYTHQLTNPENIAAGLMVGAYVAIYQSFKKPE